MLHRASNIDGLLEQPKQWKMNVRFGTWNVRCVCRAFHWKQQLLN